MRPQKPKLFVTAGATIRMYVVLSKNHVNCITRAHVLEFTICTTPLSDGSLSINQKLISAQYYHYRIINNIIKYDSDFDFLLMNQQY